MKRNELILLTFFIIICFQSFSNEFNKEIINNKQKEKILEILANYDSASLDAEKAKEIHEKFRLAEIKINPVIERFIEETGFDSQKLKELSPPPQDRKNPEEGQAGMHQSNRDEANIKFVENSMRNISDFSVASSGIGENGYLSIDYTGDGKSISLPVSWSDIPEGTKYFALNVWHLPNPKDYADVKSYWLLYNIPADVNSLSEGVKGVGVEGYNDKDNLGYDPMKSKGPGIKEYNLTVYALSDKPIFSKKKVSRIDLLKAIENLIIEEATITFKYDRHKK